MLAQEQAQGGRWRGHSQTSWPFLLNKNLRPLKGQAPENHYNGFSSHKAKNAVLPVDYSMKTAGYFLQS